MHALVTAQLTPDVREALEREFGWTLTLDRAALHGPAFGQPLPAGLDHYEAAIVEADPISAATLEALPRLRLLACVRGEPVNIDVAAATTRGIPVLFAPGRNAEAVADFTLGLLLAVLRSIAQTHHLLMSRVLTEQSEPTAEPRADVIWMSRDRSRPHPYALYKGPELKTLLLGLVGFGEVGRCMAQRAVALGMRVLVHDPYVAPERIGAAGCGVASLHDLLRQADIVSLHARGSAPLLGERELRLMKRGSYLINTARATLVDYDALYRLLRDGHLAGAGLDVFPEEPLSPDSPLLTLSNVTLTPHLAGASTNVVEHQSAIILANLATLLQGGDRRQLAIKNPEVLESWYQRRAL